jgi:hypothetical protein
MKKTREDNRAYPLATRENTVFVTVAAYEDYNTKTAVLRKSATDHGISLVFCDTGEPWQGFYHHKIGNMGEHLRRFRDHGKQFAFILDCRDVAFIESLDSVLMKFNALDEGRVIFNQDAPGKVWPSHNDDLAHALEAAMGTENARLNAGMIAGTIETILTIQQHAINLRRELKEGCPREGIAMKLYLETGTKHSEDDQHLYQMAATYYPELFHIDYDKELFALLITYPKDRRDYSDDPQRRDVINNAAILHSPWQGHGTEWFERVFQNRWRR